MKQFAELYIKLWIKQSSANKIHGSTMTLECSQMTWYSWYGAIGSLFCVNILLQNLRRNG